MANWSGTASTSSQAMQSGLEFAEALGGGLSESSSVSHHCASFARLLSSLLEFDGGTSALVDMEARAHAFLSRAYALRPGLFRDLEIVCILFQFTRQILLSMSSSGPPVHPADPASILSAFSDPLPPTMPSTAATESNRALVLTAHNNLIHLGSAIEDLKCRLCRASLALRPIFFRKSTPVPIFALRYHLARLLECFLFRFHPDSDLRLPADSDEFPEIESPIGTPVADKAASQLLDAGGPLVVGICGPAGFGKTSVASCVASDSNINRRFIGGVYWLSVGENGDVVSLQRSLWSAVSASQTAPFNSAREGLDALVNVFSERLPSLLILDDVRELPQLQALLCLEGKEHGRILVTARDQQLFQSTDAHIHSLGGLEEEEAVELFRWVAAWDAPFTPQLKEAVTELARRCSGSPLLVQAIGSALHGVEDKQKLIQQLLVEAEAKFAEGGKKPVDQSINDQAHGDDRKSQAKNSVNGETDVDRTAGCAYSVLFPCFSALGIVHPLLQQCFLDLAGFPQGEWVTLSKLEDIWLAFSSGLSNEEILVVLSILISRSMLDWRLKRLDASDRGYQMEFKLFESFHQLASRIIDQDNRVSKTDAHFDVCKKPSKAFNKINGLEGREISQKCVSGLKKILGFHKVTVSCGGEEMKVKWSELATDSEHNYDILHFGDVEMKSSAVFDVGGENDLRNSTAKLYWNSRFLKEYRLFDTGSNINLLQGQRLDESLVSKATKLSLCNTDVDSFPTNINCPHLRVGLLKDNVRLSFIPSVVLRTMNQLLVLDLEGCISLQQIPRAISALTCLQLLDLTACTSLQVLPSSIGDLKNLRILRICGCTSLTHLPRTVGFLPSLEVLRLNGCMKLRSLPSTIGKLFLLKILDLKGCLSLQYLPVSVSLLKKLQFIDLSKCINLSYTLPYCEQLQLLTLGNLKTASMAVPTGLWSIGQIEVLQMAYLKNIVYLPHSVGRLKNLRQLNLSNCRRLEFLPEEIGNLSLLQELDLSHTAIRKLPDSLGQMRSLLQLCLHGCCRLLCIPSSLSYLPKLRYLDISECWDLVLLPKSMGDANSLCELVDLDVSCCSIKSLPYFSCHALPKLTHLKLSGCCFLQTLPPSMELLTSLEKIDLEGCHSLTSLKGIGLSKLEKLAWLSLRNCTGLTSLPTEEIVVLNSLKYLDVSGCTALSPFPQAILGRAQEGELTLIRWGAVWP